MTRLTEFFHFIDLTDRKMKLGGKYDTNSRD